MAEPDRHPAIQGFLKWVHRARSFEVVDPSGQNRRAFVPVQKLNMYFDERNPESNRRRLDEILEASFLPEDPPLYAENVVPKYTAVFATLLHINKQRYIKDFTKHSSLAYLPFVLEDPPSRFPNSTEDPQFFSRFCDEQWKFCAPTFQRHMLDEQFESKRILPITYKERLGGGGSGTLYKIKVHKLYNELILDETKLNLGDESASTFVLKTYMTEDARKYYHNEVAAFRRLRPTPNLIDFYGSYIHGNTFNILLEFADKGNLERYFQEEAEPRMGGDVIKFWRSIFMLAKALTGIHEVGSQASMNGSPIFQGWHQDIKPENILIVSKDAQRHYDWQFKLSDLGLSHFNSNVVSSGEPTASDAHGTRTYGAPECYRADDFVEQSDIKVKQNVDIWSLGCVFSEAAQWVAGGKNGLHRYREERKAETNLLRKFRDGDCFHDGEKALRAVHRCHKEICASLSRHDHITERAIDVLIKEMLGESAGRPTAMMVWIKSQRILEEAQDDLDQESEILTRSKRDIHPPLPPQLPPGRRRGLQHPRTEDTNSLYTNEVTDEHNTQFLDGEQSHSPEDFVGRINNSLTFPQIEGGMRGKAPAAIPLSKIHHASDGQVSYGGTGGSLSADEKVNPISQSRQSHSSGTSDRTPHSLRGVSYDAYKPHLNALNPATGSVVFGTDGRNTESLTRASRILDRGKGRETTIEPILYEAKIPNEHLSRASSSSSAAPNSDGYRQAGSEKPYDPQVSTPTSQAASPPASSPHNDTGHRREISYGSPSGLTQQSPSEPQTSFKEASGKAADPDELPSLSVGEALTWKRNKKSGMTAHLDGQQLIDRLGKRDHLFLIDDSQSMQQHYGEVKLVLEALSYIVKDCDPDGTELYFTNSKDYKRDKNTSGLLLMLNEGKLNGKTDIDHRLNEILDKYKNKLDAKPSFMSSLRKIAKGEPAGVRPLNIYVLTDGMWESRSTGATTISNFVEKLVELGKLRSQVGIQFISFGNYQVGLRKMEFLDSRLGEGRKQNKWLDIVDTTPSTGNVWKMLLGAINETFDND